MKPYLVALSVCLLNFSLNGSSIEEVVQNSLTTNPHMKQKISEYRSSLYDLDKANAGFKPTITLNGGIGPEHTERKASNPTEKNDLIRKEASLIMTENLFSGFHTLNNITEQKARIESTQFYTLQEANALTLQTVQMYLAVVKNKELLDLEYENLKTHERIHKMMREKMVAGYGRRADLEQSEARMAQASSNYIAQLNNYQDAVINFERLSGQILTPTEKLASPVLPATSLEELIQTAFSHNPTILVEHANVSTKKARYEKDKSSFYPIIDAELSTHYKNNIDGYENDDNSYRGLLKLSYNLYNGGNDEAISLQNLQNITSQELSLNEQQRAVVEKLKLAWMSYQYNSNRIRCLKLHRDLSKKTANSYAEEYQLGRRTLLDLLNIELEYTNARKEVAIAESELQTASYRILESTGLITHLLHPDFYSQIGLKKPHDVVFTSNTSDITLTQYGDTHGDIKISEMCTQVPTPIKQTIIPIAEIDSMVQEPVSKTSGTRAIIIDETAPGKPTISYANINFAYKSSELSEESRIKVARIAEKLSTDPEVYIEIHGHTDNIGSDKYNQTLSYERAQSAKNAMVGSGAEENRIYTFGHSFHKPIADNTTEEGRQQNHRIEFIIKKATNANQ